MLHFIVVDGKGKKKAISFISLHFLFTDFCFMIKGGGPDSIGKPPFSDTISIQERNFCIITEVVLFTSAKVCGSIQL